MTAKRLLRVEWTDAVHLPGQTTSTDRRSVAAELPDTVDALSTQDVVRYATAFHDSPDIGVVRDDTRIIAVSIPRAMVDGAQIGFVEATISEAEQAALGALYEIVADLARSYDLAKKGNPTWYVQTPPAALTITTEDGQLRVTLEHGVFTIGAGSRNDGDWGTVALIGDEATVLRDWLTDELGA